MAELSGYAATLKGALLILALSVCPLPLPAAAAGETSGSVWLGLTALEFDYEEFDDRGDRLDREQGLLPGVVLGASYESEQWLAEGNLQLLSGDIDYDSPTVDSKTTEEILDLTLIGGTRLFVNGNERLDLIAGAGYRKWSRDIHSTLEADGLDETYRWGYGLIGVRGEHRVDSQTRLLADLYMTRTVKPNLEVSFVRHFDDTRLDLGAENGFRATLALQRNLGHGKTLWLKPWYEYWKLGRSADAALLSNGIRAGTVFEPDSETRNYGVNIGLSWIFPGG